MPVFKIKGLQFLIATLGVVLVALIFTWIEEFLDVVFVSQVGTGTHWVVNFGLILLLLAVVTALVYIFYKRYQDNQVLPIEELARELSKAGSLAESAAQLACYGHRLIPGSWVVVYSLNPASFRLEAQAACDPQGQITLDSEIQLPESARKNGSAASSERLTNIKLVHQGRQVGVITIEASRSQQLTPRQLHMLQVGSLVAAPVLENFIQRILASDQIEEAEARRRSLAQDLHDTLAQNIGFLRLKLDQLTCQPLDINASELADELARLHSVAEEAYEQVRSALGELNPSTQEDLAESLFKQAQSICQRANLRLRTSQIGVPFPLPVVTRHHVLYIAREGLNNSEKHAQAGQIHLQLVWLENELILKITDDGIGFDAAQPAKAGHHGLWIMHYRAREAGGDLKITPSEEGHGTEVTLWIPRRQSNPEQGPVVHPVDIEFQGEA